MKHPSTMRIHSTLLACCLAAAFSGAQAAETSTATSTTTTATTTAVGTSTTTEAKLAAEFADFLGGTEQAGTIVSGLRQGTAFDLATETTTTDPTTNTTTTATTTTTIDPPTGTLGYGNVRITLRLAQSLLSQQGITQPTAEELSAVLLGGDLNGTAVSGILTMRAEGMGWGQIAQQYGMTVGQIMGKGAGLTGQTAASAQAKGTKTSSTGASTSASAKSGSSSRSNGYIPSGKTAGAGIVTGMGGGAGSTGNGNGKGQTVKASAHQGGGMVSAGSQHASAAGVGNAGGSSGTAPGQVKKN